MNELEKLKIENKILKKKLQIVEIWMKRIIKEEIKKISKRKINKLTASVKESFIQENIETVINERINKYFWDFILMNIPSAIIDNIISAEINYYNLKQNPWFDGISIISSYQKALDLLVETNITKWYRKYCKKIWQIHLRKNDTLEKSLHAVVNKWYIISLWRLFHIIKLINENEKLNDYTKSFKDFLEKYEYIKNIVLDKNFYKIFEKITESEVFWKKRHSWIIDLKETTLARKYLIWDFKDQNSMLYFMAKISEIDY